MFGDKRLWLYDHTFETDHSKEKHKIASELNRKPKQLQSTIQSILNASS